MDRKDTLACVITYRNPKLLKQCLKSLEGQCDVYVRDNSHNNILFTAAANEGIKRAQILGMKYCFICCDDVTVGEGCVAALADFLDRTPNAAIASPLQIAKDGKVSCGGCTDAFPYGRHITEPLGHELYAKPFEQYWANGAAFLLRMEAAYACGRMDEGMRFICSDSDYSFTMRSRGWTVWMVPDARVTHEPNGALATTNKMLEKQKDIDSLYFIGKWISGGNFQAIAKEGATLTQKQISEQLGILLWRRDHGYND